MKKYTKYIVIVCCLFSIAFTAELDRYESKELNAAQALIERRIPGYSDQFILKKIDKKDGKDVFKVDQKNNQIRLRGNSGIMIATALNHYLKNTCNAHLSWCGDQLSLPEKLPLPEKKYKQVIQQKYRAHFNYCTFSYSAPWWDWERWQREIDFLAMNGVNLALSVVGTEKVWYNTLLKNGFSDQEARSFLVGPAYFAWQWMTNIQSHGGPLPKSWLDKRAKLGKKIMDRMVKLGMQPIQQGFSGYVPRKMQEKFPEAKMNKEDSWVGFEGTMQLDPMDPLFLKLGHDFLQEQKKLFGAHGYYACDPFHEGHPPKDSKQYLNNIGKKISSLYNDFDASYTWVMQAWSIRENIVKAVDKDKLLILDLDGSNHKKTDYFWGYDFITGNIHNFGGRTSLHGDLSSLAENQYMKISKNHDNVVGTGLFMEGIRQNPIYYDLAFEVNISDKEIDLDSWLDQYALRRYGNRSKSAEKAVHLLHETAYQRGTNGVEKSSMISARPALNVKSSGPSFGDDNFNIPYDNTKLLRAFELLLQDSQKLKTSEGYRYDVVDILREVLSNYAADLQPKVGKAFRQKNEKNFKIYSSKFLELLLDVDRLLRTRSEFSFEKWIKNARSWGNTEAEKKLYDYNASMLKTIWGPEQKPLLFDYAWSEWSGLIKQYYYMRWKSFFDMLSIRLKSNTTYSEKNAPSVLSQKAFRANDFYDNLADKELEWIKNIKKFPAQKDEDEIKVAKELYNKYKQQIISSSD